jgi:hypothetical protein
MTHRHPLNLPPGSVRALLALMISGLFAVLVALPADRVVELPLFLYPLLSLLLVFAVTHRGHDTNQATRPFGLPRGLFRFVIVAGIIAALAWQFVNNRELLWQRLTPTAAQLADWPILLGALAGGFLVGTLLKLGPWRNTAMYQDLLAWLSLLCMIGLAIETLAVIFIHPTLPEGLNLRHLESFLTAAVALYFGARS